MAAEYDTIPDSEKVGGKFLKRVGLRVVCVFLEIKVCELTNYVSVIVHMLWS